MISIKTLIVLELVFRLFMCSLKAQPDFNSEISCLSDFEFDSSLFFRQFQPSSEDLTDNPNCNQLFGPYFDEFPQIRADILSALKYYPELDHIQLRFSYKPIRQTMNSRPSPINIFRKKANRRYTIIVNNNRGKHPGLDFEKLSFNIKLGWLGHELSHTCEYETMNTWQTLIFSVKYVFSKKFVRKVERYTDMLAIRHGLAFPLYDGTTYLLQSQNIDSKYRKYTLANSLTLTEIKCLWSKFEMKKNDFGNTDANWRTIGL